MASETCIQGHTVELREEGTTCIVCGKGKGIGDDWVALQHIGPGSFYREEVRLPLNSVSLGGWEIDKDGNEIIIPSEEDENERLLLDVMGAIGLIAVAVGLVGAFMAWSWFVVGGILDLVALVRGV